MTIATLSALPVAASTIIARAIRILIQTSSGEVPTTQEMTDGLESLNAMLDSWRNERLMCYSMQDETVTMVSGTTSYTIGATGTTVTNRPVRIDSAYVVYQSVSYPIDIYTQEQYAAIPYKAQQANFPTVLYYQPEMPDGKLFPYPVPNAASDLHVLTWTPLLYFPLASTTTILPPGWQEALATNLAIKLAPEYQQQVSKDLDKAAREAKANIKRANNKTPIALFDGSLLNNRWYNWKIGTP